MELNLDTAKSLELQAKRQMTNKKFRIWKACKDIGVLPPGVKEKWEHNSPKIQAQILAFYSLTH